MSSHGSGALILELPARLLADAVTVALCVACAAVVEVVVSHFPDGPGGLGVGVGLLLMAWHIRQRLRGPALCRAILDESGTWQLETTDGRRVAGMLLRGSRSLGPTLVLRWQSGGRRVAAWLTGLDLPAATLRQCAARLRAADPGDDA